MLQEEVWFIFDKEGIKDVKAFVLAVVVVVVVCGK